MSHSSRRLETDGYWACQVTAGARRASRVRKPAAGHFAKAKVEAGRGLWEFPITEDEAQALSVGGEVDAERFNEGQKVDVIGTSIGKGYAGVIKRLQLPLSGCDPRQLLGAPCARVDRTEPDARTGLQGQAHGRTHG